jgi:hypothetical protein
MRAPAPESRHSTLPARDLSEKERALVEAARREAAEKKRAGPASSHAPTVAGAAGPLSRNEAQARPESARGAAIAQGAAGTPLDQPTVVGWDHPAARATAETSLAANDRERWARVGELLKAERMAEEARRERLRRNGLGAVAALLLIALAVAFASLLPLGSR